MKKSVKGLAAAAAGVAVIATGTTFALWSDSDSADGGVITSGVLDVDFLASSWVDASDDRTDEDHPIDLSTFLIVPGDTVEGTFPLDIALQGDNLLATLEVGVDGAPTGALLGDPEGVTVTYSVFTAADVPVAGMQDIVLGTDSTVTLRSTDNVNPDSTAVLTAPLALDGTEDYYVLVTAVFDENTPDQVRQSVSADLQNLTVGLTQTRTGAGFN